MLIAPLQNQLQNSSNAGINYQYGKNAMIGGSGTLLLFALFECFKFSGTERCRVRLALVILQPKNRSISVYWRHLSVRKFVTHPIDTYTLTNTVFGFYTHYFTKSFSFSILAGPEQYTPGVPRFQEQGHWTPAVQGSFGWQTLRDESRCQLHPQRVRRAGSSSVPIKPIWPA